MSGNIIQSAGGDKPVLQLNLGVKRGAFDFAIDCSLTPEMTAIMGASGSGKSTLIHLISGLIKPDRGSLTWGGQLLNDVGRRFHVKPHSRQFGVVFQESRLFPHLDVAENLRYSPRYGEGKILFDEVVGALQLDEMLTRDVNSLSGGEKQRVALGRALLSGPEMLLLDEPVNALDRASRLRFMSFLALVRKRFEMPMLFATHDPELVLEFADAVLMLEGGRLKQEGTPRSVLRGGSEGLPLPANLFQGRVTGNDSKRGLATVALGGVDLLVPSVEVGGAEEVWIRILASDLTLMRGRPEALSARNVLSGVVTHLEPVEGRVVVEIEAGELWRVYVVPDTVEALELKTGAPISLVAKATAFEVYPIAQEI